MVLVSGKRRMWCVVVACLTALKLRPAANLELRKEQRAKSLASQELGLHHHRPSFTSTPTVKYG